MNIRIFDPQGVKAEDYRHRYPELQRVVEFDGLHPKGLMFVWFYANQTSPLVLYVPDDHERAEEALKRSGYNPGKVEREKMLNLQWDSQMAAAIRRMSEFDPDARFKAYKMVRNIFDHYETIIQMGPEAFQTSTVEGKGDKTVTTQYTDYKRYVDVSAKVAEELPGLLSKLEEGFAIVTVTGEEIELGSNSDLHEYHAAKDD